MTLMSNYRVDYFYYKNYSKHFIILYIHVLNLLSTLLKILKNILFKLVKLIYSKHQVNYLVHVKRINNI